MPLLIVRNDITKLKVDAIVNAANTELRMGGGVCGAIFRAAGEKELKEACDAIGWCPRGQAVITDGFRLPARYIIHTPGPVWRGGRHGEEEQLRGCYANSLRLAKEYGCASVAFPLISAGIYGYPKDEALRVATAAIGAFLNEHDMDVYLVVFDKASFAASRKLIGDVQAFIDEHYAETTLHRRVRLEASERQELLFPPLDKAILDQADAPLEEVVGNLGESFSEMLLRLIDAKGMTDVEVYKRANIDRKLFSKIRSNKSYMPSKRTALALAIALRLGVSETEELLEKAGYALSRSRKFDVIIEYFIRNENYNIYEINKALFHFDEPLLGV
jgi:O-acetyl-ADP-ribose deacetylase (regulator of RNase III)/transcriptional regulator with XRE-family HTH domain